ncbi:hypothetical protein K461DRAFT_294092 [Myriangium duriaei CBS 260.36]|uniref:Uncharacterized protein n=1 Tax=Myriangium duriaei CBS 260.36 TaxID=1168546 RepID=A0A9P4MGQ6_9PEZI|nr:hypothetical protein K461DRAFT_294092 [Myriangium duriaei CBS 260.36]
MSSISPISPRAGGPFSSHAHRSSGSVSSRTLLSPTAWLDLDLNFIRADDAFCQMFPDLRYSSFRRLSDIAYPVMPDAVQALKSTIRREREVKDPSYLPPILMPGEDSLGRIGEVNEGEATRGFEAHTYQMNYSLANGVVQTLPTKFNLAKTSRYFIIMTLPPISPDFLSVMVQQGARRPASRGDPLTPSEVLLTRPSTASSPTWSSSSESREMSRGTSSAPTSVNMEGLRLGRHQAGTASWDRQAIPPQSSGHIRHGQMPLSTDTRFGGSMQHNRSYERTSSVASSGAELDITRSVSNESVVFSDDEQAYPRASNLLPPLSRTDSRPVHTGQSAEAWMPSARTGPVAPPQRAPEKRRRMDIESLLHR